MHEYLQTDSQSEQFVYLYSKSVHRVKSSNAVGDQSSLFQKKNLLFRVISEASQLIKRLHKIISIKSRIFISKKAHHFRVIFEKVNYSKDYFYKITYHLA